MYTVFNFGYQEFWGDYDPTLELGPGMYAMGEQKVHFDGPNKWIVVNNEVTELNVQTDIYSAWKEWMTIRDNSKFPQALTAIGGESISETQFVGRTYFLENGWRIKTWEGDHVLAVDGNIYTREPGQNPFIPPDGDFAVTVSSTRSNLVDFINPTVDLSGEINISNTDINAISLAVWDTLLSAINTSNSIGVHVKEKLLTKNQFLGLKD